jgi:protein-tyrosine-phosphatase/8-oxo-dGTP pyrophosphatase MutT (NUDIX family)
MSVYKVHFVCNGNVFRSRLARAYTIDALKKAGRLDDFEITSSGLMYWENDSRPIDFVSPWAYKIAVKDGVDGLLWGKRNKASTKRLNSKDLIIFMNDKVVERARTLFKFDERKMIVWNVKDVHEWEKKLKIAAERKRWLTRRYIKMKVRELVDIMIQTSWADVVSENNEPEGYRLPVPLINQRGLWHRGVHAIVSTPNGGIVVQKRSKNIYFAPNLIDISLGGHVDDGEAPETAMVREFSEELSYKIYKKDLKFMELYKQAMWHPHYNIHNRVFVYTYHIHLDTNKPEFEVDEHEVSRVAVLNRRQMKTLLDTGYLVGLGQLNYTREYYRRAVKNVYARLLAAKIRG